MKCSIGDKVRVQCVYTNIGKARKIDGRKATVTGLTTYSVTNDYRTEWYSLRFSDTKRPAWVKSVMDSELRPA